MGLPRRSVEFGDSRDKPETYVKWDNILYRPEAFPALDHEHPTIFESLIQVVDTVPSNVKKGQMFFIRKR